MAPEKREHIEALWRRGLNILKISQQTGIEYKTCWTAVKRLETTDAR